MSNGWFRSSDLFVFSTQRGYFLAAAATPNKHMDAMYLYTYNQNLSFSYFILFYNYFISFYNSKNRHLEF